MWFFDRAKARGPRRDKVLFVDARPFFKQVTRAIREFAPEQLEFLANVVRLYRGEVPEFDERSQALIAERFPAGNYSDVAGLCKAANLAEIEAQAWSLNPGRYVGVGERTADEFDFAERLAQLRGELVALSAEARDLESSIENNVTDVLAGVLA